MTATTLEQSPFVVGTTPSSVHTDHLYLPTSVGVVAAHLTQDATRPVRAAALLLPPVGYPYHSAYSTMRLLAEALAESGVACLRVDYHGTGNAEGSGWEAERLAAWQTSAEEALAILHSWTRAPVGIVGLQLGGTLALSSGGESDFVVAWGPVTSGRRFVRSLRLLGQATPEALGSSLTFAGFPFPEQSLEELARLSLSSWRCQAHDVLVVASEQDRGVLDELAPDMPDVRRVVLPAPTPSPLAQPSEEAEPPRELIVDVVAWVVDTLADPAGAQSSPVVPRGSCDEWTGRPGPVPGGIVAEDDGRVTEQFAEVAGLHGVMADPASGPSPTVVVFLNSGSEMNAGPGRAWVDYSRALAAAGTSALRLDFSAWGGALLGATRRAGRTTPTACPKRSRS